MQQNVLFITPPFTQLNTPYPATAYLKGFLNTKGYKSEQTDLGIEVILKLFSKDELTKLFQKIEETDKELSENSYRIYSLRQDYIQTIEPVILFLQNKNPTLAHSICDRNYLPEASRFAEIEDMDWAFGTMGIHDKARHFATLYLEDLADLIKEIIDPHFGFSRYAERLGRTASNFDELHGELQAKPSFISCLLTDLLDKKIKIKNPDIVCFSVPFPGNLFSAFICGKYLKANYPNIKIAMGGGYCNTELRSISDERVFEYIDYICLDDGEAPLMNLLSYLEGKIEKNQLKRTFTLTGGVVCYYNNTEQLDVPQRETGTPDYHGLPIHDYLSVIEIVNPMHRLWSDGRWNKLTLAHGCYWGKCSFCDVTLDYIQRYEPLTPSLLCDRIEEIIEQTGQNGFHFVDEAAPPVLMRDLALEIIRRKITVTWWTNIRFEKSFTADLCRVLKKSGCIAVSGGLEVASDRLLKLMKKGVTVAQVAKVTDHFTQAGIMVHAYLMYGFPTQTNQETIDSLEMVRQLLENGVIQSGFWHQFAMTAHSPVGLAPQDYQVERIGPKFDGFAENDLYHEDKKGAEHELFSEGLKKSLFNYMHGVCFDFHLSEWFNFETPETSIEPDYIANCLQDNSENHLRPNAFMVWTGNTPEISFFEEEEEEIAQLSFFDKKQDWGFQVEASFGEWLYNFLLEISVNNQDKISLKDFKLNFENGGFGSFEDFVETEIWEELVKSDLLIL